MIDTHCHLTYPQFTGRVEEIIWAAKVEGVSRLITVGTKPADCLAAQDLASRFDNVWFTAGMHPLEADEPRAWELLERIAEHPRCVAFGELGLDNHYPTPARAAQDSLLEQELEFIERVSGVIGPKPIVVHCREAVDELLTVFAAAPFDRDRYVFHCFTGTPDEARRILDFGAWISFTGVVTFKNAPEVAEAAKLVPADRIMVETDAPYLSPEPVRNVRPNEPRNVVHVARFVAGLRGVPYEDFERQVDENADRFFGLGRRDSGVK